MEWISESLFNGPASFYFAPGLAAGAFGLIFLVLGWNAKRTRRLSNARSLWLITGTREFEGHTAVVLGQIILIAGLLLLGLSAVLSFAALFMAVSNNWRVAAHQAPAPVNQQPAAARQNSTTGSRTGASGASPGATSSPGTPSPAPNGTPSTEGPSHGPAQLSQGSDGRGVGGGLPPGVGAPPAGLGGPGGFGSPGGFGGPGDDFQERMRKSQEEFERRKREFEERHRQMMERGASGQKPGVGYATPVSRKWTSADGKFSLDATFVEKVGSEVRLQKADGPIVKIEMAKLSTADQEWLAQNAK